MIGQAPRTFIGGVPQGLTCDGLVSCSGGVTDSHPVNTTEKGDKHWPYAPLGTRTDFIWLFFLRATCNIVHNTFKIGSMDLLWSCVSSHVLLVFLFFCLSLNSTKSIISYVFILKPLTNLKDHLIEAKKGKQIRMIGCFSLTYCMGILLGPRLVLK